MWLVIVNRKCLSANITIRRHSEEALPIGSDVTYRTDVKATVTGIHQAMLTLMSLNTAAVTSRYVPAGVDCMMMCSGSR
jgi:hypothetical protein